MSPVVEAHNRVTTTGTCCSHLQRIKSDPHIIGVREGTLALCSSPLKLNFFLLFLSFHLPLVVLLAFASVIRLRFTFYCFLNSVV